MTPDHDDIYGDAAHTHPDYQKLVEKKDALPKEPKDPVKVERAMQAVRGIEPRDLASYANDPTLNWTR